MQIGVTYTEPGQQLWLNIEVPDTATVREAIERSPRKDRLAGRASKRFEATLCVVEWEVREAAEDEGERVHGATTFSPQRHRGTEKNGLETKVNKAASIFMFMP